MTEQDIQFEARGPRGRFVQTEESVRRDAEALRLRSQGWSYQQISDKLKYGSAQNASRSVARAISEIRDEAAEDVRRLELGRLDDLTKRLYAELDGGDARPDHRLQVIDRLLRVQDRRAKLLGLDKITVTATVQHETEQDRELAEMIREAQARAAAQEAEIRGSAAS